MGMAITSVRATIQRENPQRSSQDNGSLATVGTHISAGGAAVANADGVRGTAIDRAVGPSIDGILGVGVAGGSGDGGCGDGQQDDVNQLEEDRKTRRRQVERTAHRVSRASALATKKPVSSLRPPPRSPPIARCSCLDVEFFHRPLFLRPSNNMEDYEDRDRWEP